MLDLRALNEQVALSPSRVGASRVKQLIDEYEFGRGVTRSIASPRGWWRSSSS